MCLRVKLCWAYWREARYFSEGDGRPSGFVPQLAQPKGLARRRQSDLRKVKHISIISLEVVYLGSRFSYMQARGGCYVRICCTPQWCCCQRHRPTHQYITTKSARMANTKLSTVVTPNSLPWRLLLLISLSLPCDLLASTSTTPPVWLGSCEVLLEAWRDKSNLMAFFKSSIRTETSYYPPANIVLRRYVL